MKIYLKCTKNGDNMIVPLRDFVVVVKDEAVSQTPGGLFVPQTAEEKVVTGKVVAVGSGKLDINGKTVPLEVSVGDRVAFNKNFATEVKVDGETHLLLREDQVFCVVK